METMEKLLAQSDHDMPAWSSLTQAIFLHVDIASPDALPRQSHRPPPSLHRSPHVRYPSARRPHRHADPAPPPIPDRAPGHTLPRGVDAQPTAPRLKKRASPKALSLRELRDQQSEADLRSAYERQIDAYLNDDVGASKPRQSARARAHRRGRSELSNWSFSDLSSEDDDIREVPEEEDAAVAFGAEVNRAFHLGEYYGLAMGAGPQRVRF